MDPTQSPIAPPPEVQRFLMIKARLGWTGKAATLGGLVTSAWLLYAVFAAKGFWIAVLCFAMLGMFYGFGPAAMFVVASIFLCFYFHAVGIWLPVLACILALLSFYVALHAMKASRAVDPHHQVR